MEQYSVLGLGEWVSAPSSPSSCTSLKCGALRQRCGPPALGASHLSLSYPAAHSLSSAPPAPSRLRASVWMQSLSQVGFPLVSASVQSQSLTPLACLVSCVLVSSS